MNWEYYKRSTSGASLFVSKYQQAYRTLMAEYHNSDQLPLFVFYSDSFPHIDTRTSDFEIKDFFPIVDDKMLSLYLRLKNGRDVIFDNLPAGYKRLYSIAFDLAYRLYILRKTNNEDPKGIAIIDEIDLHLHPSLEQEVLARLKKNISKYSIYRIYTFSNGTFQS